MSQTADQPDETPDRDRPARGVAGPLAGAVARRKTLHRDRCGGWRRRRRTPPPAASDPAARRGSRTRRVEAAQHPHEQVIRSAALGDRLDGEQPDHARRPEPRAVASTGPGWDRSLHGGAGEATAHHSRRRTQTRSPWSRSSRAIAARTSKPDCASSVSPASTPSFSAPTAASLRAWHLLRRPRLGLAPAAIRRRRARAVGRGAAEVGRRSSSPRTTPRRSSSPRRTAAGPPVPHAGPRGRGQARRPRDHRLAIGGGGARRVHGDSAGANPSRAERRRPRDRRRRAGGSHPLASFGLDGAPYVFWIGSLEPRKNVGLLVDALVRWALHTDLPHRLVLAGPAGWLEDEAPCSRLRRWATAPAPLGRVGDPVLGALYRGADVFAFPSRHEGFRIPVLEAMAQETPVIAADIPRCGRSQRAPPSCGRPTTRMRGWPRSTTSCTTRPSCHGWASPGARAERYSWSAGRGDPGYISRGRRGIIIPDGTPAARAGHRFQVDLLALGRRPPRRDPDATRRAHHAHVLGRIPRLPDRAPARAARGPLPRLYPPVIGVTGVLYTIPSLALFVFLIPWTGLSPRPRSSRLVALHAVDPDPEHRRRPRRRATGRTQRPRREWGTGGRASCSRSSSRSRPRHRRRDPHRNRHDDRLDHRDRAHRSGRPRPVHDRRLPARLPHAAHGRDHPVRRAGSHRRPPARRRSGWLSPWARAERRRS